MNFQPAAAEYSSALDRIIFVSNSPSQLHVYDPLGPSIQSLDLPAAPIAMSVLGNRAAVRHHNSVTLINLSPLAIANTFTGTPTPASNYQGLVLTPEWIHVGGLASVRLSTGAITTVPGGVELTKTGRLLDNSAFYGTDTNGAMYRYDISTGPITARTLIFPFTALTFSIGQTTGRLYTSSGKVYTPTPTSLVYFGDVSKDLESTFGSAYVESPVGNYAAGVETSLTRVGVYERDFYTTVNTQTVSAGFASWVFFDNTGTRLYVVAVNGTSASVEISNWASTTTCAPTFESAPISIHRDGGVYRNSIVAPSDCRYVVQSSANWIRMVTGERAGGNSVNTFFAYPNRTGSPRSATITAGSQTMTVTQEATSSDPGHKFGFSTFDPQYRRANGSLILASPDLNFVLAYYPSTKQYETFDTGQPPMSVGLQPNGDYVAVGHAGSVTVFPLNPNVPQAILNYRIPLRARGVALPGNGYLYAYDRNDTRGMYWRNLTTGQSGFVAAPATTYSLMTVVPARRAIYWQGYKWDISNGVPVRYDRATNCAVLWANESGTRTYGCGKAYIASDVAAEDGLDAGTLSPGWADQSAAQQAVAILDNFPSQLQIWNDSTLTLRATIPVPAAGANVGNTSRGARVFWSSTGAKLYAMVLEPASTAVSGEGIVEVNAPANCTYTLSSTAISVPYSGYSGPLNVTTQSSCQWTATLSGSDWASLANASATGSAAVTVNVSANPYATPRRVAIQVASAVAIVTQAGNPGTISVSPQVLDVPASASTQTITVTSSTPSLAWTVRMASSFFTPNVSVGTGTGSVPLNVTANTGPARSATALIGGVPVVVRQAAGNASTTRFTSNGTALPGAGGTAQITIEATGSWTATTTSSWLQILSPASGTGNGAITVSAPLNPAKEMRFANIDVGGATYGVVQSGQQPLEFYPLTPCRVADTRNAPAGPLGQPIMAALTERTFPVTSSPCGVPSDAVAYSMNVTVVPQGQLGYLTIHPAGEPRPVVSLLNSLDGRIKANSTILRAGTNGGVTVFVTGTTHVVLDINGYFAPPKEQSLAFRYVTPCRILDTRNPNGPRGGPSLQAAVARTVAIAGTCSIPASAKAYALNITAIPKSTLGYLTVWPTGQAQPTVSTLNAVTGTITANAAVTPAGNGGSIDLFANNDTDLLIDVNGYFDSAVEGTNYFSYFTVNPCRLADTRLSPPAMQAGETRMFIGNLCGVPIAAVNLTLNATVIPSGSFGYLTLWDPFAAMPVVSTLNAVDGALTSNSAFVMTGIIPSNFRAFTSSPADLLFDVTGYFSQSAPLN